MTDCIYRYQFEDSVPTDEIEASLLLAVWSCEALHGEAQTRLDVAHYFDPVERACVINATTPVGRDLNRLFIGYVRREFGDGAFQVKAASSPVFRQPAAVAS